MMNRTIVMACMALLLCSAPAFATTTIEGKPGTTCGKDTTSLHKGKVGPVAYEVCWQGGGDPALNGTEVIVDATFKGTSVTWRQVLDVYVVKRVTERKSPKGKAVLALSASEHTMNDEDEVITRKASYILSLAWTSKGLSPSLTVSRK